MATQNLNNLTDEQKQARKNMRRDIASMILRLFREAWNQSKTENNFIKKIKGNGMNNEQNTLQEIGLTVKLIDDLSGSEKEIKLKTNLTFEQAVKVAETNLLNESLSKVAVLQLQDKLKNGVELIDKFKEAFTLFPILLDVTNELNEAQKENENMRAQIQKMKADLKEKFGIDSDEDIESEANNG